MVSLALEFSGKSWALDSLVATSSPGQDQPRPEARFDQPFAAWRPSGSPGTCRRRQPTNGTWRRAAGEL